MMMGKLAAICSLASAVLLGGCQTTDPGPAASIQYRLPSTNVQARLTLDLQECNVILDGRETAPTRGHAVLARLSVTPIASRQDSIYSVSGIDLSHARIRREFALNVRPNGVIQSVNSTTDERSPEIIGNSLKLTAQLSQIIPVTTASNVLNNPLACRPEVRAAITRARLIEDQITYLRQQLISSNIPAQADRETVEQINELAAELVSLRNGILRIETTATSNLAFNPGPNSFSGLTMNITPFVDWFDHRDNIEERVRTAGERREAVERITDLVNQQFALAWTAAQAPAAIRQHASETRDLRDCDFNIAIPDPTEYRISVTNFGTNLAGLRPAIINVPVGQWRSDETPYELCLDAGFGENRTVNLAFDEFGRTAKFTWNSDARVESVTAGLAGAVTAANSVADGFDGSNQLERDKAEIEELTTQRTLNQLRACQAILDAGGFTCPTDAAAE